MTHLHRWTRRQTLGFLGGMAGSIALHACSQSNSSGSTSSDELIKASLGVVPGWIGYTPLYIALEKGFFKDLGLDLSLVVFGSNPEVRAAFSAGKLDGQTSVTSEAVLQAETGKDFKMVLVEDNSLGADGILARNSVPDIQSFKGKEIAVEVGGVSHFFLLQVLKEAGLTPDDVTLVNVLPDAAAAAYQSGKVEIAVSYSPFMFAANDAQKDGRIIYDSAKMPAAIIDLYLFDSQFVATHPTAISALVQGIFKALDFLKTNEADGLAIASKELGIAPDDLKEQLKGVQLVDVAGNKEILGNPNSDLYLLNSLTDLVDFLLAQGQIQTPPDMSKYIEPQFVNAL